MRYQNLKLNKKTNKENMRKALLTIKMKIS